MPRAPTPPTRPCHGPGVWRERTEPAEPEDVASRQHRTGLHMPIARNALPFYHCRPCHSSSLLDMVFAAAAVVRTHASPSSLQPCAVLLERSSQSPPYNLALCWCGRSDLNWTSRHQPPEVGCARGVGHVGPWTRQLRLRAVPYMLGAELRPKRPKCPEFQNAEIQPPQNPPKYPPNEPRLHTSHQRAELDGKIPRAVTRRGPPSTRNGRAGNPQSRRHH
jgi:hypothetical protein